MTVDRSVLFGVPIDGYTMAETSNVIDDCVRTAGPTGARHQVTTVNVDFLVNAINDPDSHGAAPGGRSQSRRWYAGSVGIAPTRHPVARAGGRSRPRSSPRSGVRHAWLAGPPVRRRARRRDAGERHDARCFPDAQITADSGPPWSTSTSPTNSVIESIRAVDADVLCVALGNPKQERFIASYRDILQCPVMIGIGGSLDMLVGDKKRAPKWAQRSVRSGCSAPAQEPGRLGRRYAHDLRVFGP